MFKLPYVITAFGIVADYLSSQIGLHLGGVELNSQYSPLKAASFYFILLPLVGLLLRKSKYRNRVMMAISLFSLFGVINNTLVIYKLLSWPLGGL